MRKRCRSASSNGPTAKKVKFEDIHKEIALQFLNTKFNPSVVSDTIKTAFPHTYSKVAGKSRLKHVFEIESVSDDQGPSPSGYSNLEILLAREAEEKRQLLQRVQYLEEQVKQLEQLQLLSLLHLSGVGNTVMHPGNAVYHGSDSITHFDTFSVDTVVTEFKQFTPDLLQLFKSLGRCQQHVHDTDQPLELDDVKVATSLCTLMKCRSVKVLGLQLLLTFILSARATSKQVSK